MFVCRCEGAASALPKYKPSLGMENYVSINVTANVRFASWTRTRAGYCIAALSIVHELHVRHSLVRRLPRFSSSQRCNSVATCAQSLAATMRLQDL